MREKIPEFTKTEEEKERNIFYQTSKGKFARVFDSFQNGSERIGNFISENEDLLRNNSEVMTSLKLCESICDRKEFVEAVFNVMKPLLDIIIKDPDFIQQTDHKQINDALSYDIKEDSVYVHVFTGSWEVSLKRFIDGLKELAEIIKKNENIKMIMAESWIVAEHPKILERLGFSVDGEIENVDRQGLSYSKDKKIGKAHMAREDFLKRYLVEDKK